MVKVNQYLTRLHQFAESFTGRPVSILLKESSSSLQETKLAQAEGAMKIYVPRDVKPQTSKEQERLAHNVFKGLVALQASAYMYRGIPERNYLDYARKLGLNPFGVTESLESLLLSLDTNGLTLGCFNAIELARRTQCISEDYNALGEDMSEGFNSIFDPKIFRDMGKKAVTDEIDLALTRAFWESFGIDPERMEKQVSLIRREWAIGDHREELYEVVSDLSRFRDLDSTSWKTSMDRVVEFRDYIKRFYEDLNRPDPFLTRSEEQQRESVMNESKLEEIGGVDDGKKTKLKRLRKRKEYLAGLLNQLKGGKNIQLPTGLDSEEHLKERISAIERTEKKIEEGSIGTYRPVDQFIESERRQGEAVINTSFSEVFQEIPKKQLTHMDLPKQREYRAGQGNTYSFPEVREKIVVPNAVNVTVYDLLKDQPKTEAQIKRADALNEDIRRLGTEIGEYASKIWSDVNYIYDIPELQKSKKAAERKLSKALKELANSEKLHDSVKSRPIEIDYGLVRRLRREMESIKPEARTMVRNCFEGELDQKKYFEYWLQAELGKGHVDQRYFYQWQKRRRDVASLLLIDASNSLNRLVNGEKSMLDSIKEASYYYALGGGVLEDGVAVMAYNGKGHNDVRVFLLKDFSEGLPVLGRRLELLRGELNNRDGAAIRYSTHHLANHPAKTKFLFHLGDMQPSDVVLGKKQESWIQTFPYEGDEAMEDVTNAYNAARSQGVIPVGICIQRSEPKTRLSKGRINPAVLAKLRQRSKPSADSINERLR